MELNQSTLRGILASITSVNENYIVPKQGNWWNPQEQAQKPDTWCAYMIRSNQPRTLPFYHTENGRSLVTAEKIATIDLQFVGPQSEEIAQSVALWPLRSDVARVLKTVQGALLPDDMTARSTPFHQDGTNNVVSWNVTIRILWYSVQETGQAAMPGVTLEGTMNRL